MPHQIVQKTVEQLKALGAEEIGSFDIRQKSKGYGFDAKLDPNMDERFRKSIKKMEGDEFNPNFYVDEIDS